MEIIKIALSELTPDPNNAKDHPAWQIEQIKNSIEQFGNLDPIGVWGDDNLIVEGHGRYEALKELGYQEAECIRLDWLTEEERTAYALAHNKLTMNSGFIPEALDMNLDAIGEIDMSQFGFEIPEEEEPTEIAEDELPEEVETRCKLGDIWRLGDHRLICGDSTDVNVIDRLMDGAKADMVFTDPPYGMNAVSKSGVLSEHYKTDIMNDDDNTVAIDAFNMAKEYFDGTKQIWWGANYYTECLPSSECWIVWDKNNGASDQTDCELAWSNMRSVVRQFTMASEKINRVHPTQKPCKLFAEILHKFDKDNSVKKVVDLFGGSGSTLIACEQLNRKCYICELDPHYCDVIIQRWENLTGGKAVRINDAG